MTLRIFSIGLGIPSVHRELDLERNSSVALTGSIDAALGLMERVLPGWRAELVQSNDGKRWDCYLGTIHSIPVEANSTDRGMPTLPLAILLATLRALQSLPEGDVR